MYRTIFLFIAIMLLAPLLYVIFFTPVIARLLRRMDIGRSTGEVKVLVADAEKAVANRVRDLEAQKKAADEELNAVVPIEISMNKTNTDLDSEPVQNPVIEIAIDSIDKAPRKKKTSTTKPTE